MDIPKEEFEQMRAALERYEAPYTTQLRMICEEIGYGRVIQIAEEWMDKKNPGWLDAHHKVGCR